MSDLPNLLTISSAATIAGRSRAATRWLYDAGLVTGEVSPAGRVKLHRASLEEQLGRPITAADICAAEAIRERRVA